MSTSSDPSAAATAHSFNKILNQFKSASKARSAADMEEATKKLRRLILVDGMPSTVVCMFVQVSFSEQYSDLARTRIRRSARGYGRSCCACGMCRQNHSLSTSVGAHVKCERRSGMTHSGECFHEYCSRICLMKRRTLATDRGFKERVSEDMLVRLLDAFVWRNHGEQVFIPFSCLPVFSLRGRPTRERPARLHVRSRHERSGRALSLHHAIRARGLLLLR